MSRKPESGTGRISSVRALVESLFNQRGLDEKRREYQAWLVWEEVVGPQVAARAKPVRIRDGVLEVRVDHPVWMQQLQLLKPKILAKLNAQLGENVIRDLFLRRGAQKTDTETPPPAEPGIDWKACQLSEEEVKQVKETVTSISDPQIRQSLEELITKQRQLENARRKED